MSGLPLLGDPIGLGEEQESNSSSRHAQTDALPRTTIIKDRGLEI